MTLPNLAPYLDAVVAKGVYWLYHGADKAETQFEAKKKKKITAWNINSHDDIWLVKKMINSLGIPSLKESGKRCN